MEFLIKSFDELSKKELYDLLSLRAEVFVVEQDCVYQDVDHKDQKAYHILGYKQEELVAYTRMFKPGAYFDKASIGRVVVKESHRGGRLGYELMNATIKAVADVFKTNRIELSAQEYLLEFYKNLGFNPIGESYLEDGIPHRRMIKD
jgi:ElaA protein